MQWFRARARFCPAKKVTERLVHKGGVPLGSTYISKRRPIESEDFSLALDQYPSHGRVTRRGTILGVASALLAGCRSPKASTQPSIEFIRIPQADEGGREKHDIIQGRVTGGHPGQQIVLYSRSGVWWVQPLVDHPFTRLEGSRFSGATHLGTDYAALLVEPGYHPPSTANDLPPVGGAVAAIATVKGQKSAPSASISFAGYEWRVRDAPSDRGGQNFYDPRNAWTGQDGALHLRIAKAAGKWTCAEVSLTRSLGYGSYSCVVRDTGRLEPAAVFSMFTYDYAGSDENYHEVAVEVSRWGDQASKNAQYVIQPYYVPSNVARFEAPSGPLTHSFRWEPGRLSFNTTRGSELISEHVFTSGVPSHGIESVRMNLYVFRKAHIPLENEAEVVIDKFQYLP
jgi:hypothetical protein